ncbi:hypothetical protein H3H36_08605 [Duganella sp. FT3S]|uniref:Uncharacterized protein n=1 Tax=Rugamonas fusca TaxID=2758568 RepID=A0A7W2I6G4_9BURK|nr:hypothetical protein [Rugamonas fusca]
MLKITRMALAYHAAAFRGGANADQPTGTGWRHVL